MTFIKLLGTLFFYVLLPVLICSAFRGPLLMIAIILFNLFEFLTTGNSIFYLQFIIKLFFRVKILFMDIKCCKYVFSLTEYTFLLPLHFLHYFLSLTKHSYHLRIQF